MLVEGQIQSVCQFHLVFILVHFNLFHRLSCIIILQVVLDGLRNQQSWHDSLLAVYLCKISFFVEFQLRAILQNYIIASADNSRFNRCKHYLLTIEMTIEQGLGLGRKCIYRDRLVVARIRHHIA